MFHQKLTVVTMVLFLVPGFSWAADYKNWLPHFPDQLDGMKATSKGEGMNINSGDTGISQFTKTYSGGKKEISISITHSDDGSGQKQSETLGEQINMETSAMVMKSIKIHGFNAMYQHVKDDNSVLITVYLKGQTTLMFAATGISAKGDKYYIGLFDKINLKKI